MNLNPFPKPNWYRIVSFTLLTLTICVGVYTAVFVANDRRDPVDNLAPGPYVIERLDGVQLFAMPVDDSKPDEVAWTRDIAFAKRYGTLTQAQIGRDRIGEGHVAILRQVAK